MRKVKSPAQVGKPAAADSSGSRPAQAGPRIFLSDEYSKQKLLESLSKDELAEKERILEWSAAVRGYMKARLHDVRVFQGV